jgi:nicotinamidase-related amidase
MLKPQKTALIVLDLINGITESPYFNPYLEKYQIIAKANQLIQHVRRKGDLIIFVKVGFSDNYAELAHRSPLFSQNKPNNFLKLSESGTSFHPKLDYQSGDIVVIKHRISAFYSTSLEAILNSNEINHVVLCGVSTNMAVEATARDAHDRNYFVTIIKDACCAHDEEDQESSLRIMSSLVEIKTVSECIL